MTMQDRQNRIWAAGYFENYLEGRPAIQVDPEIVKKWDDASGVKK